jgi:hypothetical protein
LGGGRDDARRDAREGAEVQFEHLDQPSAPKPAAVRAFVEAVLALSDDPQRANVERYLRASHVLEDSRSRRRSRESRGLTKGRT